jgi:hypothetical protein
VSRDTALVAAPATTPAKVAGVALVAAGTWLIVAD